MLTARFDGGCYPNPGGFAASACLVVRGEEEVYRWGKYLGYGSGMTNNVAEFEAMREILRWYLDSGCTEEMKVIGDSQVVIWRMLGKYRKPVQGVCAPIAQSCLEMKRWLPFGKVSFEWERRCNNEECDAMCNQLMEEGKVERETKELAIKETFATAYAQGELW